MPKKKTTQPELIREERAEYRITPEDQTGKDEYRARLRTFLEDPASRKIEGFPIGEIGNILALSDPPYYTACPNPFLVEIFEQWQKERPASKGTYHREPFAADVSEGKEAIADHERVEHAADLVELIGQIQPLTAYLSEAKANLSAEHTWSERAESVRTAMLNDLRQLAKGESRVRTSMITRKLEKLKSEYITVYAKLQRALTLGPKAGNQC